MGVLHVVSTPIGNLEDITLRARRVLGEVDCVLAEDTRRTGLLLQHLGVKRPLLSLHAHNEAERTARVLERLAAGESLALVSDAGTPLVSDPGARLVRAVAAAGHTVVPVPGASSVLAALVASGLPADRFTFLGFVPRRRGDREPFLARVAQSAETTVVFESPERLSALLDDLVAGCGGDREACVARELTKLHETFVRGTLDEVRAHFEGTGARGEVTVLIAPAPAGSAATAADVEAEAERLARQLLDEGGSPSRVARAVAERCGIARNRAYELVQTLGGSAESGG